jgi:Ser/Thr protein kinase RdoA (MazF antagonist)
MGSNNDVELDDESWRKLLVPAPVDESALLEILRSHFYRPAPGQSDDIRILKQLDSYDDLNYLVQFDSQLFVLKIHNGVESRDYVSSTEDSAAGPSSVIHLQHAMMTVLSRELSKNKISVPVPITPMTARIDGSEVASLPVVVMPLAVRSERHSPCLLVIKLLSYVPGRTMQSLSSQPIECLAQAGRVLAQVHQALDTLSEPLAAARRYHQWDGKNTADLLSFTPCISNPRRRQLVESVVASFIETLGSSESQFRTGLIHGDFNDANILVNDQFQITGVIDFGDSVERYGAGCDCAKSPSIARSCACP